MKFSAIAAIAATIAMGAAGTASAHVYTTQLDWNNRGLNGAVQQVASEGLVTVTENAGFVDVLVELYGTQFTDTGNTTNHYPFSFNIAPPVPVSGVAVTE